MRRQREDESGLGNLHDGLAEEARRPGSCTSPRAAGCSPRGSAQTLQLKVERCVLLKSVRVVLLENGECVQGEPAREREGQLVECRQARQQHWRHKGATEQEQRSVVGTVLVVIAAGEHGEPNEVLTLNYAPHRTFGVAPVTPAVHGARLGRSGGAGRTNRAPRLDTVSGRRRGAGAAGGWRPSGQAGQLLTDSPVGPR